MKNAIIKITEERQIMNPLLPILSIRRPRNGLETAEIM